MRRLVAVFMLLLLLASCTKRSALGGTVAVGGAAFAMGGVALMSAAQDSDTDCAYGCGPEVLAGPAAIVMVLLGGGFMMAGVAASAGGTEYEREQELAAQIAEEETQRVRREDARREAKRREAEVTQRGGVWRDVPAVANEER